MNSDQSLMSTIFEHRQQFSSIIDLAVAKPSQSTANQLKVQILIISEWLWTLSAANTDVVSAQCLFHPSKYSTLANKAFCAGVLTRNLCHKLNWHGHCAKALIGAALTMDIGLGIDSTGSADVSNDKKSTKQQQLSYIKHPLASAAYLHKYQVISKYFLKYIIEHQERLNGSGFPKALRHSQISTPGKLLALAGKFSDLISSHPNRPCYSVKQALRFLAQRGDEYCPMLLAHLSVIINKPCPTMTVELAGQQQGIIHQVDHQNSLVSIAELVTSNQDNLVLSSNIFKVNFDQIVQIIPENTIYNEATFGQICSAIANEVSVDNSFSSWRLKPEATLAILLAELADYNPDHQKIARLIGQLDQLGQQLILQLTSQYPSRRFNDSFHALQMAGFQQSKSLLSLLGLYQQLNGYDFPARRLLSAKVDCVLTLCRQATNFTNCVEPNQAAIFALLNLAPLYFELAVIQMPSKITVNLKQLNLTDGYSLMALKTTTQQRSISNTLAQQWDNRHPTLNALKMLGQQDSEYSLYRDEIIAIFHLSLLLTHHVYHGISFDDPLLSIQSKSLFREMKLSPKNIEQLLSSALSQAPLCELSQDL